MNNNLEQILNCLREANAEGTIVETIWMNDHQTLFDFIELCIEEATLAQLQEAEPWRESWRVGVFCSSANPDQKVICVAEASEIEEWQKRSDFIRWLGDPPAAQPQEAEPVAEVGKGKILQWAPPYNRYPEGTKLYLHPPKPAAQPQVPDADEIYRRFCAWCDKNKALDLDPRLHTHSGSSMANGAYISDIATRAVFAAYRDGFLSAAREEGK